MRPAWYEKPVRRQWPSRADVAALLAAVLMVGATVAGRPAVALSSASPVREGTIKAVLVVRHADGAAPGWAASPIIEAAHAWAQRTTDLDLRSPEQAGFESAAVDLCPGARLLSCLTQAVPEAESLLFLMVVRPGDSQADELTLIALDLSAARRTLAALASDAAEDALYASLLRLRERAEKGDLSAVPRLLEKGAGWLESMEHSAPYGHVEIDLGPEWTSVSVRPLEASPIKASGLDVVPLPATLALRPGVRELTFSHVSDRPAAVRTLEVSRGARTVRILEAPDAPSVPWVRWTSGAVSMVGAGLLLGGVYSSVEQPTALCVRRSTAQCPILPAEPPILLTVGSALAMGGVSSLVGHLIAGDEVEPDILVLSIASLLGGSAALVVGFVGAR